MLMRYVMPLSFQASGRGAVARAARGGSHTNARVSIPYHQLNALTRRVRMYFNFIISLYETLLGLHHLYHTPELHPANANSCTLLLPNLSSQRSSH